MFYKLPSENDIKFKIQLKSKQIQKTRSSFSFLLKVSIKTIPRKFA